ncbi:SusC/RagA family TonB-linked outer membrane protein [Butyricimonas faecihominis]|uniref:SusC/RagA family TonB-linked outer membrane protein n=1 Tax=Butyricimonas faecihominis TaxID=1472416 RepID=UPI0032BFE1D7
MKKRIYQKFEAVIFVLRFGMIKMAWLTFLLLFHFEVTYATNVFPQEMRVSLDLKDASMQEFMQVVKEKTGVSFIFSAALIEKAGKISLQVKDEPLNKVLNEVFAAQGLSFIYKSGAVIVKKQQPVQDEKKILVKGRVTDTKNTPLPGVTITIKGTSVGTSSDVNGKFQMLLLDSTNVLVFSFVGMEPQEVKYQGQDSLVVKMKETTEALEEVVVTGYQEIREKTAVGSYSKVKSEDLIMTGTNSLEQMLQGKVPGMMVINSSGLTGQRQKVRVRGTSTVLGNAEPVWVVDGIIQEDPLPFEMEDFNATIEDSDLMRDFVGGAIDWLNPSEIEDITVLKDAAATAIYGVKAANGVIVIRTKRGERGKPSVSYYGRYSGSLRLSYDRMEIMNSQERVELAREGFARGAQVLDETIGYSGLALAYLRGEITREQFEKDAKYMETVNTDWFKILYRNPLNQEHSVSISGGNQDGTYRASVGYTKTQNTARGNERERYRGSINITNRFSPKLNLFVSLSGSYTKTQAFANGVDPFGYAMNTSRTIPCYDESGGLYFYSQANGYKYNILNELANSGNENTSSSININANLRYSLTNNLRFGVTLGGGRSTTFAETWFTEYSNYIAAMRGYDYGTISVGDSKYQNSQLPFGGYQTIQENRSFNYTMRLQADWGKSFGLDQEHRVNVMAGWEARSSQYNGYSNKVYGYQPDRGKSFATLPMVIPGTGLTNSLLANKPQVTDRLSNYLSYYVSASYNYYQRYSISMNVRGDASNRFGQDKRNKFTPVWSTGFRWNITEEPWMQNVKKVFTDLSLMATFGYQGNVVEAVSPDLIVKFNEVNSETGEQSLSVSRRPSPDIRWEKTLSMDYNLSWSLFRNRINGNFSYYYKKTTDLIVQQNVALENGVLSTYVNQGDLENWGWDMYLSFVPVRTENFTWSVSTTFSHNSNKVRATVNQENPTWRNAVGGTFLKEGYPVGAFWAFRFVGIDQQTGGPIIDDTGIEQEIAGEDPSVYLEYMGQRDPATNLGINMVFRYKRFSFPLSIYYVNGGKQFLPNPWTNNKGLPTEARNASTELNKRWRVPGDRTNIPGIPVRGGYEMKTYNYTNHASVSYYPYEAWGYSNARVVDKWYIRFNDFSFAYDLPERWIRGVFKSVRVSFFVSNPLIIKSKDFKGRDPEVAMGSQPRERSFSLGLDVKF